MDQEYLPFRDFEFGYWFHIRVCNQLRTGGSTEERMTGSFSERVE
jgi:hypothetical protein